MTAEKEFKAAESRRLVREGSIDGMAVRYWKREATDKDGTKRSYEVREYGKEHRSYGQIVCVTYPHENRAISITNWAIMINESAPNPQEATVVIGKHAGTFGDGIDEWTTGIRYTSAQREPDANSLQTKEAVNAGTAAVMSYDETRSVYQQGVRTFNETVEKLGIEALLGIKVECGISSFVD